jgi:peptidoglycan/xylan/chitin deacetylase (PgdA/CDA1 family)
MPFGRVQRYYQRRAASFFFRRPLRVDPVQPVISFTFDDFPRSALVVGGAILKGFGLTGTYYASLGLMDQMAPTGRIFSPRDLQLLIEQGHELGCHTYAHCHSWDTQPSTYAESILRNRDALSEIVPGATFKSFSYPICPPRPRTKSRVASLFGCSRGGGQTFNAGTADLNQLSAFFLEKSRDRIEVVRDLIGRNRDARGWLILATHDVSDNPTPFGCTPAFCEGVVRHAMSSGARILPVAEAVELLTNQTSSSRSSSSV